ncbi:hypothetical protein [Sphingomonas sp. OK281]|uniref:hypothetical protein n=1 Tax=Sphingomonas sp. OK281 TaxID=1881067 RepID=UPI0015874A26|nr:hypothetical protein [Sphingomonas sp. OK281]
MTRLIRSFERRAQMCATASLPTCGAIAEARDEKIVMSVPRLRRRRSWFPSIVSRIWRGI